MLYHWLVSYPMNNVIRPLKNQRLKEKMSHVREFTQRVLHQRNDTRG